MLSGKYVVLAGLASLFTTAVNAADLPPLYAPAPLPAIQESYGWYLRGDIGFSNQHVNGVKYQPGPNEPTPTAQNSVAAGFDSAGIFGVGIGYQFNSWLRTDITGEYRGKSNYRGQTIVTSAGNTYPEQDFGSKSEWLVLANVYADLGTWWNVTPFIGAGIGGSYNRISNFQDMVLTSTNGPILANNYYDTGSKWNLAWAVHAGLSYRVNQRMSLEFSYRYLNLGDAVTGAANSWDGLGATGYQKFDTITSHDFRIGLRYMLEAPMPQPVMMPPIMRKG